MLHVLCSVQLPHVVASHAICTRSAGVITIASVISMIGMQPTGHSPVKKFHVVPSEQLPHMLLQDEKLLSTSLH